MPTSVKRAPLWRTEIAHEPGQLASALGPLAASGADLQVVMAYRLPGEPSKAAVEVYPVTGRKQAAAAAVTGLAASNIPMLLVEGDNRVGLGAAITGALADAGINLGFLVAIVMGRKYKCVVGLESEADAKKAAALIKRASQPRKKASGRRT